MLYGTLFTMPPASEVLASTSEYSSPIVTDFLPVIYLVIGLIIAFFVIGFLIYTVANAMQHRK